MGIRISHGSGRSLMIRMFDLSRLALDGRVCVVMTLGEGRQCRMRRLNLEYLREVVADCVELPPSYSFLDTSVDTGHVVLCVSLL